MSNTALHRNNSTDTFWSTRREAALNWLALGLLLAAWNASDNDASNNDASVGGASAGDARAARTHGRPEALRGYSYVSVRAVNRVNAHD